MKIIGLAGRAGSGKSAVAEALAQAPDIVWVDLDRVAWETYARGEDAYERIVERFGGEILAADGSIDRGELAVRVFVEAGAREDLEAIVHPAVVDRLRSLCEEERSRGTRVLLVEGALLTISPHVDRSLFDAVLWFDVPDEVREVRLRAEGRADHAARGNDVHPDDGAIRIDASAALPDVVALTSEAIETL